ncbi:hypothetical protein Rifp1Sym_fb00060 [endosymbiont of Riftia pachyptila (vent Ph05)]|uniref:Uncharacterized protein n=1 Tax=endosymbiont of Riftia pachyptila (vent Ph05) TaxID=1048808 RepID=G2DHI5_9GAMM|nr:hypothetical protein Rifp1Sym_fb00060 [endosymbiont of Riftia pachyptila (vent Ph05)]
MIGTCAAFIDTLDIGIHAYMDVGKEREFRLAGC